jgi:hypothetical protein
MYTVGVTYYCPSCYEAITVDVHMPSINIDKEFEHTCFLCGSENFVTIETRAEKAEESEESE